MEIKMRQWQTINNDFALIISYKNVIAFQNGIFCLNMSLKVVFYPMF